MQPSLYIKIISDEANSTITIEDSGIGMTRNDLIKSLGTIAKVGTKACMEAVLTRGDISMLGPVGMGFYSGYRVADKIRVVSKHNDDEQYIWESRASGHITMQTDTEKVHGEIERGTKMICYLRGGQTGLLEERRLKDFARRSSQTSLASPSSFVVARGPAATRVRGPAGVTPAARQAQDTQLRGQPKSRSYER